MKKTVTVDFDGTLSRPDVQEYIQELLRKDVDVYVLTSRYDELHKHKYPHNSSNKDLYTVVDTLGIPRTKIRFTCMEDKYKYLDGTRVIWHLDDDYLELDHINSYTKTRGISVNSSSYKNKCNKILGFFIEN